MGHLLSITVPGNRGIVLRRSLPKLHESTERIYLEVLKRSGLHYTARENRDGWPHRVIYPNGSEVVFRETKDLGRFLGPEYGWFLGDEFQEEPEKTFKDLVGRLRLPRASQYLRGMIATNPPSTKHWIAKYWPRHGAFRRKVVLKDQVFYSTFRMIRSSTVDNPHLDPEYVAGLMTTHTPQEVKRIIQGNYGFTLEGNPVYVPFDETKHVGDPPIHHMQVYRVWDFGYNQPAVGWSQIFRCRQGKYHFNFLFELDSPKSEAEALAPKVLELTDKLFPEPVKYMMVDGGDAAGAQHNDKGPGPIIRLARSRAEGGFNLQFRYRKFPNMDPGLDEVRKLLRVKCECGQYLFMVHRRNQWLIEALAGGYHYPVEKPGKDTQVKPIKDGYYDNIADVLRYTVMLFYKPLVDGVGEVDWLAEAGINTPVQAEQGPWAWMNP